MMNILQLADEAPGYQDQEDVVSPAEMDKTVITFLQQLPGLKRHDCLVLQQGMGSLARISSATTEEILRYTSLSAEKAKIVVEFFKHDRVI